MLDQLYQDFELILYSAQPKEYTRDLAKLLTLNPPEPQPKKRDNSGSKSGGTGASSSQQKDQPTVFTHILSKEECIYNEELDRYIVDLDIFTGPYGDSPRDLADIVFITDSYTRVQGKHVRNVIPVSSFGGSKKDFSMVALGRYLKTNFSLTPNSTKSKTTP